MPIQGSLDEVSLADVLQLLSLGRKSGRLSLDDGMMQGHIYLHAGRICYASVVNRRDQLGDILVKAGKITRRQLKDATERQTHDRKKKLGEILVGSGSVERGELDRFVRAQVQEAVSFMFTWNRGSFKYESRVRPPDDDFLVSLDAGALLLEAARRVDEWSLLKKKIPSFDIVFRIDETRISADVSLTEAQKRILPLLDGSRDIAAVVEATGLVEFEVAKALYGLITAGFAHLVERRTVMRHLSYREFLAYLVREAEFADPHRRRKAARHLAECSLCSTRLKRIHRQTGVSAGETAGPAPQAGANRWVVRRSSATPRAASAGMLAGERRSGSDRRKGERRWGDRRLATRPGLSAIWPSEQRGGEDRRTGDRRMFDRRAADREQIRRGVRRASSSDAPATPPKLGPRGQRPRRRSSEIEWLVTPDAALELLRQRLPKTPPTPARRTAAATRPTDKPKTTRPAPTSAGSTTVTRPRRRTPAPRQAKPARRESGEQAKVSAKHVAESTSRPRDTMATGAIVSAKPVTVPPEAVPPGRVSGVRPGSGPEPARRSAERFSPAPPRLLLVVAALVGAAGMGWLAGFFVGRGNDAGSDAAPTAAAVVGSPIAPVPDPIAVTSDSSARAPAAQQPENAGTDPGRVGDGRDDATSSAPDPVRALVERETSTSRDTGTSASRPVSPPAARSQETGVSTAGGDPPPPVVTPSPPDVQTEEFRETLNTTPVDVATIKGVVRDARTGQPLAGASVSIRGSGEATRTNVAGAYELPDLPAGPTTVEVAVDGYLPGSAEAVIEAGATVELDVALRGPPVAVVPDTGLAGQWAAIDRGEAASMLGQAIAVIPGLWIESIAKPIESSRPKVRVAHLSASGERIVLVQSRSGAFVRGGPARVTALRIMPPSEAYPVATGTASFGRLLVTAQSTLAPDSLRSLLAQLSEHSDDAGDAGTR